MKLKYFLIAILIVILPACGGSPAAEAPTAAPEEKQAESAAEQEQPVEEAEAPAEESEESKEEPADETKEQLVTENMITTDSGLQYVILEAGDGPSPEPGELVSVHYAGTLEDGTEFDNSYRRGEPIQFPVGMGMVIPGWDEGIGLLKVGDKAKFVIPPELGYGAQGAGGVIPPNATLIFEVELLGIQPGSPEKPTAVAEEDYVVTDSGLKYYDLEEGTGETPKEGQAVQAHYTGWLEDGTKFDSSLDRGRPFQLMLGVGHVIPGWDEGLSTMKVGGKRQLVIPPDLAYGEKGAGEGLIPPNATLIFELELLSVSDHQ